MTDDSRFPAERAQSILNQLRERGRVVASELALQFAVSEDSIRRDLRELATQGLCQRVHGGAVLPTPVVVAFPQRAQLDRPGKSGLAALTCSLLQAGQVIFLDAGTTNLAIAQLLPQRIGLTVITSAPQIAIAAGQREGVNVVLIGGDFSPATGGVVGSEALLQIQRLRVDIGIPGACTVDASSGIWAMNSEEAALKRAVVAASARVIIVAASEKLGARGTYQIADINEIDDLVVDAEAPELQLQTFTDAGIGVHRIPR